MREKELTKDKLFKKIESIKEYPLLSTLYKARRLKQSLQQWLENISLDYLTKLTEDEFMSVKENKSESEKRVDQDMMGTLVTLHQISFDEGIEEEELIKNGRVFQFLLSAIYFNKMVKKELNYSDKVFYIDFPTWKNYKKFKITKNPEVTFEESIKETE